MVGSLDFLIEGFKNALLLIITMDPYLMSVIKVQFLVSGTAIILSTITALPLAVLIAFGRFPGKNLFKTIINTAMGLPPVVVGVFLYIVLTRDGPFGFLHLLNTPWAMIIAQYVLATPIILGISLAAIETVPAGIKETVHTLGGTRRDIAIAVLKESFYSHVTAVLAGFGRAIAEVGAIFIVGGGIYFNRMLDDGTIVQESLTRTLTVAAVVETRQGLFANAMAYGLILLLLSFILNSIAIHFRGRVHHG